MFLVLHFLALLALSPQSGNSAEEVSSQEAATRASECGLGRVWTRYDEEILTDVLAASPQAAPTDQQLACLDRAAGYYNVELPPVAQQRFETVREMRLSGQLHVRARAWLSDRELLDRVPIYRKGVTSNAEFARQLEVLCGPQSKGAINTNLTRPSLDEEWLSKMLLPPLLGDEAFDCVANVARVAGFDLDGAELSIGARP
jgi:hypothetical protein